MTESDGITTHLMNADAVICTGVGKSGKVAALAADLLQAVGVRATFMSPTDLMHGGINFLPWNGEPVIIYFTHSGFTEEIMVASEYARSNVKNVLSIFVTSVPVIDGADYVIQYEKMPEGNYGTIPVNASISQIDAIGRFVNRIANLSSIEFLHRGHPKGNISRIYERLDDNE